jgi:hypothetical protein
MPDIAVLEGISNKVVMAHYLCVISQISIKAVFRDMEMRLKNEKHNKQTLKPILVILLS